MTQTSRYFYPWACFMLFGFCDALLQTFAYWVMGAVTNDANVSARYRGVSVHGKWCLAQSRGTAMLAEWVCTSLQQVVVNLSLFQEAIIRALMTRHEIRVNKVPVHIKAESSLPPLRRSSPFCTQSGTRAITKASNPRERRWHGPLTTRQHLG